MSALQSVVRSTTIKCEEHLPSNDSKPKHYHRQGEGNKVSYKLDSQVSNLLWLWLWVAMACCRIVILKQIFSTVLSIYWIQKLLLNEWTTLICLAVRWVLARSGHSWPVVGSWTLIYDDKTFVPRKYCELCCTGRCWPSGRGKIKVEKLQIIEKAAETFLKLQKHS